MSRSRCYCGKAIFYSSQEAEIFVDERPYLKRWYKCPGTEHYHVTSMEGIPKHLYLTIDDTKKLRKSAMPLPSENPRGVWPGKRSLKQYIFDYMEAEYEDSGKWQFTSGELADYCHKTRPVARTTVSAALAVLRSQGWVEKVGKVSEPKSKEFYYSPVSVLEKVTSPENGKSDDMTTSTNSTVPTPAVVSTTPFDKVNSTLGEIKSKVEGLANGYVELARTVEAVRQGQRSNISNINYEEVVVQIKEAINQSIPVADGSEDYKRGVRDGIQMAVQMGLKLGDE